MTDRWTWTVRRAFPTLSAGVAFLALLASRLTAGELILRDGVNDYAGTRDALTANTTRFGRGGLEGTAKEFVLNNSYVTWTVLVRFDLAPLKGKPVTKATLLLPMIGDIAKDGVEAHVFRVLRDWVEEEAACEEFAKGKRWHEPGMSAWFDYEAGPGLTRPIATGTLDQTRAACVLDVTEAVKDLVAGHLPNQGFAVRISSARSLKFGARENSDVAKRPALVIETSAGAPVAVTSGSMEVNQPTGFQRVTLDGSKSGAGNCRWEVLEVPWLSKVTTASITKADSATASFLPDHQGKYVFRLTASKGDAKTTARLEVSVRTITTDRPRLYFRKDEFPIFADRAKRYPNQEWLDLDSSKDTSPYTFYLAGYAVGSEKMKERLWKRFQDEVMNFDLEKTKLRQGRGLDYASYLQELAIYYDILHDRIAQDRKVRDEVFRRVQMIIEDLILTSASGPTRMPIGYGRGPAFLAMGHHNWGTLFITGLLAAGLSLYEEHPDAGKWLDLARESWEQHRVYTMATTGCGGGYWEGHGYQRMVVPQYISFIEMTRCATGEDIFKENVVVREFMHKTLYSTLYSLNPWTNGPDEVRGVYWDGDSNQDYLIHQVRRYMPYIITRTRDPYCAWMLNHSGPEAKSGYPSTQWNSILWWDDSVKEEPWTGSKLPLSFVEPPLARVYMRSDWTDEATWAHFNIGPKLSFHYGCSAPGTLEVTRKGFAASTRIETVRANYGHEQARPYWNEFYDLYDYGHLEAFDQDDVFVYVAGDHTKGMKVEANEADGVKPVGDRYHPDRFHDSAAASAKRGVVYIRPGTFLMFDRVDFSKPSKCVVKLFVEGKPAANGFENVKLLYPPAAQVKLVVEEKETRPGRKRTFYHYEPTEGFRDHVRFLSVIVTDPKEMPAVSEEGKKLVVTGKSAGKPYTVAFDFDGELGVVITVGSASRPMPVRKFVNLPDPLNVFGDRRNDVYLPRYPVGTKSPEPEKGLTVFPSWSWIEMPAPLRPFYERPR